MVWGPASPLGQVKEHRTPHATGVLPGAHFPCPPPQANETFAFVGNVTHYAQVWLNISAEIRSFLEQGRLQQHLYWLQQVWSMARGCGGGVGWWERALSAAQGPAPGQWALPAPPVQPALHLQYVADLRLHPEALNLSLEELPPALRQDNFSLPNGTALLQQLDTIDNAACGWIQFMSKVGRSLWEGQATALKPSPHPCTCPGGSSNVPPPGERGHLQGLSR